MDAPCTAAAPAPARRTSHSGCANHMQHQDAPLCDLTLTQVLSWLGVPDLAGSAGIVCKQWHRASECKEVWRSRMHARLLSLFCDPAAAPLLAGACPGGRFSPARLFKAVYCSNLLRNGEFLERTNSTRARGAGGGARSVTWTMTHNAKGLSWEYPLLDPSLPLPPPAATHLSGDGSPSPSATRTNGHARSAAIAIRRPPPRRAASGCGSCGSCGSPPTGSPSTVSSASSASAGSSPGSSLGGGLGGAPASARPPSGPFAVGCVAPGCFMWSELAQVVDLAEALQDAGGAGLPPPLAAAALAAGAAVEFSVWVACAGGGSSARGAAAGECQIVVGLVPPEDAAAAAAGQLPLEALAKAAAPFGDELPMGLPPAEAARAAAEAADGALRALGLGGTRLQIVGPFSPGPEWTQVRVRARLPAPPAGAGADAVLASAPKLVIALRGRAGAPSPGGGLRAARRGPKFMAARVSLVPLDDEAAPPAREA